MTSCKSIESPTYTKTILDHNSNDIHSEFRYVGQDDFHPLADHIAKLSKFTKDIFIFTSIISVSSIK